MLTNQTNTTPIISGREYDYAVLENLVGLSPIVWDSKRHGQQSNPPTTSCGVLQRMAA